MFLLLAAAGAALAMAPAATALTLEAKAPTVILGIPAFPLDRDPVAIGFRLTAGGAGVANQGVECKVGRLRPEAATTDADGRFTCTVADDQIVALLRTATGGGDAHAADVSARFLGNDAYAYAPVQIVTVFHCPEPFKMTISKAGHHYSCNKKPLN
jgi:hypothetical protein